ncbi:hypothetical protein ACFQXA_09125 [Nocardiopsis composta]
MPRGYLCAIPANCSMTSGCRALIPMSWVPSQRAPRAAAEREVSNRKTRSVLRSVSSAIERRSCS